MPSTVRKQLLAVFALGAVVGAGLEWTTANGLHSHAPATMSDRRPELPTGSSLATNPDHCTNADLASPAADPARIKGAELERWWMDVEQSVKPEE